jgi:allophanate hydrolase subunit 2
MHRAPPVRTDEPIAAVPGPDLFSPEALALLFSADFRVSTALDRVGMRLEGPKLPRLPDRPYSTPMIRGAMQVTSDGTPIVMGPDHPTTGGYPVIATVATHELGRLARLRPGKTVRFRPLGR